MRESRSLSTTECFETMSRYGDVEWNGDADAINPSATSQSCNRPSSDDPNALSTGWTPNSESGRIERWKRVRGCGKGALQASPL